MSLKDMLDKAYVQFESGKKDIDLTYTINGGMITIEGFSLHTPYEWENKKEPVYFSYNNESKSMHVSNLSISDLKDETLMKFLGIEAEEII